MVRVGLLAIGSVMFIGTGCYHLWDDDDDDVPPGCRRECGDVQVCRVVCDADRCWQRCGLVPACRVTCDRERDPCSADADCFEGEVCVANRCEPTDTESQGLAGLCQTCESSANCIEEDSRCVRINFDGATDAGENVCARACATRSDCPVGFECAVVSVEAGEEATSQCLPLADDAGRRTCSANDALECVEASDCPLGDSCVDNTCVGPGTVACDVNVPCADGLECVDGACVAPSPESCVFSAECAEGQECVDGSCVVRCTADTDCGELESCFAGACRLVECQRSADCPAGEVCVDATCQP